MHKVFKNKAQGCSTPLNLKIHQSMWIHWSFFPKTWTKGHWPLHDLWPHVCWGHMCDSTQGSLCPSPMTIHQCMWIQWSILQITTYTYYTYILHTTYRMSDHIVSYWTQFRGDKNSWFMCASMIHLRTPFIRWAQPISWRLHRLRKITGPQKHFDTIHINNTKT